MKEPYRLIGGQLVCKEDKNDFPFGIIYEDEGRLFV
jgi:hypothetical protein